MSDSDVRILYWPDPPVARDQIIARVGEVAGVQLQLADSLQGVADSIARFDGVILANRPKEQAARIAAAIRAGGGRLRRLHFVSVATDGFADAGLPAEVVVSGPAGASAPAVAEHALALLLALVRQVPAAVRATDRGTWDRTMVPQVTSLEAKTVAIVGLGQIGRQVAQRVRAFGSRTIGVVRTAREDPAVDEVVAVDDLRAVLPRTDVLVLAVPLSPATRGLIGPRELAILKPGAIVINVSRGGVIDHDALIRSLEAGYLAGAGLDVTDPEPLPDGHRLWSAPNLLISPHYAGASAATLARTADSAATMARELRDEIRAAANRKG